MTYKEIFQRLGLGKNASSIYEALLVNKEPMLITHIAKYCGIERPEVYRNIETVIGNGFIKKVFMGKRTYYSAESPNVIYKLFKNESTQVEDLIGKTLKKREKQFPQYISYYKGSTGIRAIFDDVIERTPNRGTFYRYTSERNLAKVNSYLSPQYRLLRDNKKLERLVISNPISGKSKKSRLERFIKFFPQETDLFNQNVIQLVYADSVAFINLNTEEGYIIRDKDLANFQAVIFKQLYKKL